MHATAVRSNDKAALNVAEAALPAAMDVFVVEEQLEMVVTKQTSAERKQLKRSLFWLKRQAVKSNQSSLSLLAPITLS
jgi:hypothetical protein